jgi:hypothetical protein
MLRHHRNCVHNSKSCLPLLSSCCCCNTNKTSSPQSLASSSGHTDWTSSPGGQELEQWPRRIPSALPPPPNVPLVQPPVPVPPSATRRVRPSKAERPAGRAKIPQSPRRSPPLVSRRPSVQSTRLGRRYYLMIQSTTTMCPTKSKTTYSSTRLRRSMKMGSTSKSSTKTS